MRLQKKVWGGIFFLALTSAAVITACKKENSTTNNAPVPAGKQKVSVYLNDDPIPHVLKVLVDIKYVEVKVDTGREHHDDDFYNDDHDRDNDHHDNDHFGKWDTLSITPRIYDLLKLKNGTDTLIGSGLTHIGKITKLRITLGNDNVIWTDSTHSFPLPICDRQPYVYAKVNSAAIDSLPGGHFQIRLDFNVLRSIEREDSSYCLRPQLKTFSDHTTGKIEGRVKPRDAHARVLAFTGADTTYAIPEEEGEFQIRGLKAATYSVLFKATAPYKDTTITNVQVKKGEDVKLPTVTLHK